MNKTMYYFVRRIITGLFVLALSAGPSYAQSILWAENHGGEFNDAGYSGLQTNSGDYLILGSTFSSQENGYDIFLIKMNQYGDTIWTKTYGGELSEHGYDITGTSDNHFIIVGSTRTYGNGKKDVYLLKVDSLGNVIWSRTYGGTENDEGRSIRETFDNGLIICGTTGSFGAGYDDLYLIRTDSSGDTLWTKTFGGAGGESGYTVRETADSGFIAVGATGTFGDGYSAFYAVRTSLTGDSIWADAFGGAGADFGYSVVCTPDKGYIFVGATASFGAGYSDVYLFKTDSLGNTEWSQTFGGAWEDRGYSICPAMDGNYLMTGTTRSFGAGKTDIYLVKFSPVGDTIWTRAFGGSSDDFGRVVFQESGRDYILIGESNSYSSGGSDVYVLKIQGDATPVNDDNNILLPSGFELAQNYPNPFNMSTTIEYVVPYRAQVNITVFNILGQVIKEWSINSQGVGRHQVAWDGRNRRGEEIATGIYFYRLTAGEFTRTKKMLFLK